MTHEWRPNPGDDVVIRVQEVHGDIIYTRGGGITLVSDVRQLPGMSAEDSAVIAAAVVQDQAGRQPISKYAEAAYITACDATNRSVRARAAAQAQEVPQDSAWQPVDPDIHAEYDDPAADAVDEADERERQVAAARERVVEWALKWSDQHTIDRLTRHHWTDEVVELVDACDALRALLSPPAPAPVDPMETENLRLRKALTTIRDINLGPDQASATWRVQEAASIARAALSAMEGK